MGKPEIWPVATPKRSYQLLHTRTRLGFHSTRTPNFAMDGRYCRPIGPKDHRNLTQKRPPACTILFAKRSAASSSSRAASASAIQNFGEWISHRTSRPKPCNTICETVLFPLTVTTRQTPIGDRHYYPSQGTYILHLRSFAGTNSDEHIQQTIRFCWWSGLGCGSRNFYNCGIYRANVRISQDQLPWWIIALFNCF